VEGVQVPDAIISTGLIIRVPTALVEQAFLVLLLIMVSLVLLELEVLVVALLFTKAVMADILVRLEHHKLRSQQPMVQQFLEEIQGRSEQRVLERRLLLYPDNFFPYNFKWNTNSIPSQSLFV
jgi:hypothetical protein